LNYKKINLLVSKGTEKYKRLIALFTGQQTERGPNKGQEMQTAGQKKKQSETSSTEPQKGKKAAPQKVAGNWGGGLGTMGSLHKRSTFARTEGAAEEREKGKRGITE